MAYVPIPKDLGKIKTKVAFNLTKRQLIGFVLAGIIGLPIYLFSRKIIGNDVAMLILIVISFPFFFITFYEKDGLKCEHYIRCIFLNKFYNATKRLPKKQIQQRMMEVQNGKKR